MKKPTRTFINSLPKLDRYIYHTLPAELNRICPNFECDPCSGCYSFKVKGHDNLFIYGTPFWEGHKGIPFCVVALKNDEYGHTIDLPFPESELTYLPKIDSQWYLEVMRKQAKKIGFEI